MAEEFDYSKIPKPEKEASVTLVFDQDTKKWTPFPKNSSDQYNMNDGDFSEIFTDASVADGQQFVHHALTKGKWQAIKEIAVYIDGTPGDDAYFKVRRGTGTSDYGAPLGEVYYGSTNILIFDRPVWDTDGLVLEIDHGKGTSQTANIFITVKYYYKT